MNQGHYSEGPCPGSDSRYFGSSKPRLSLQRYQLRRNFMKSSLFSRVVRVGRPRSERDPIRILTSMRAGPGWFVKRFMPSSISSSVDTQNA
ncbi:hypothetical protein ACOMHN_030349 [Nucella lapillus]